MDFRITKLDGIVQFQITRPHIHNAVNHEVITGLTDFLDELEKEDVHFGVITGEGNQTFCSGGDLSVFHSIQTTAEAWQIHHRMAEILYRLATQPVPVIALVNGTAIGGGAEIASACDYRLVLRSAKAGFVQGRLAITSGWGGTTLLQEKGIAYDKLLRFTSEAEPLPIEELEKLGWVTEAYEGDKWAALSNFIKRMKKHHPSVAKSYKLLMTERLRQEPIYTRIMKEAQICSELWEQEAHHQAVQDFLSRKKK